VLAEERPVLERIASGYKPLELLCRRPRPPHHQDRDVTEVTQARTRRASAVARVLVESVARRPGGSFGGVRTLSGSPVTSPPVVASTPRGRAFAVWTEDRGDLSELWLAQQVPGGDWGSPLRLLFDRRPLHEPAVAVSADGRRLAIFATAAASASPC
jgi:hypothetical protein